MGPHLPTPLTPPHGPPPPYHPNSPSWAPTSLPPELPLMGPSSTPNSPSCPPPHPYVTHGPPYPRPIMGPHPPPPHRHPTPSWALTPHPLLPPKPCLFLFSVFFFPPCLCGGMEQSSTDRILSASAGRRDIAGRRPKRVHGVGCFNLTSINSAQTLPNSVNTRKPVALPRVSSIHFDLPPPPPLLCPTPSRDFGEGQSQCEPPPPYPPSTGDWAEESGGWGGVGGRLLKMTL